jgi:hypothetical protein
MVATLMFAPTPPALGLLAGLRGGFDHASQTATQQLQCGPNWPWVAPHRHGNSGDFYSVILCSVAAAQALARASPISLDQRDSIPLHAQPN